jgi:hypothetical protein
MRELIDMARTAFGLLSSKILAACASFPVVISTAWTLARTPLLTTKITKDTKVAEILFLNFVRFVSFVVSTLAYPGTRATARVHAAPQRSSLMGNAASLNPCVRVSELKSIL